MEVRNLALGAAALAALLVTPAAFAEDAAVYARLVEEKSAPIVSVKLVLAVKATRGGQVLMEQEVNATTGGIVVNDCGLVMVSAAAFDPSFGGMPRGRRGRQMMGDVDIQATPSNIRVTFPGDTTEYSAILGAKDSKLGLGFVLIKDLAQRKGLAVVDLARTVEPKVGDLLYSVTRLDQGFDFAPVCSGVRVVGSVTKPRSMWVLQGAGDDVGMPLYDAQGAVAGIVVSQSGVGEDSATRPFLLPLKVATPTVAGALKKAQEELEVILEAEAKAKTEGEAAGDAPKEAPKPDEGEGDEDEGDGGK